MNETTMVRRAPIWVRVYLAIMQKVLVPMMILSAVLFMGGAVQAWQDGFEGLRVSIMGFSQWLWIILAIIMYRTTGTLITALIVNGVSRRDYTGALLAANTTVALGCAGAMAIMYSFGTEKVRPPDYSDFGGYPTPTGVQFFLLQAAVLLAAIWCAELIDLAIHRSAMAGWLVVALTVPAVMMVVIAGQVGASFGGPIRTNIPWYGPWPVSVTVPVALILVAIAVAVFGWLIRRVELRPWVSV